MADKKEEVKEESKDRYFLTKVVTQEDIAIADGNTNEVLTDKGLLVEILNKLDKIEKAVAD